MIRWLHGKSFFLFLVILAALVALAACTKPGTTKSQSETKQAEQNKAAQNKTTEKAAEPAAKPEPPRRGCAACHVKTAQKDYSLLAEAVERTKAGGGTHPTTGTDGKKMDENTTVETCLQCHSPGANGKGKAAPLSLRSILHPAHMSSKTFTDKYLGNCFTCHEVDGTGTFNLLSQKVDVNEKGLPKKVPIPGLVPPSENPIKAAK